MVDLAGRRFGGHDLFHHPAVAVGQHLGCKLVAAGGAPHGVCHRHAKGHGSSAVEAGQEASLASNVKAPPGGFDRVEDTLLGVLDVICRLLPAVTPPVRSLRSAEA